MRRTHKIRLATAVAAIGMLATACGGGGDTENEGGDQTGEGTSGGELRVYASEPSSLLPTAADDSQAIDIIRTMYRGLVRYNSETGEPEMDLAESIESEDNVTWTVTVKEGYTFTNGEPVNADAFIRAWNFAGNAKNAQNNSYFMSRIKGFDKLQPSGKTEAETEKLIEALPDDASFEGLQKVDDYTFTVELSAPFVGFPAIVGYSGFFPLAEECLADTEACSQLPIGNGPYMMEEPWEHNVQIATVRNEDYAGEDTGLADAITFRIFDSIETGYAAFEGGEIDVMNTVPPEQLATVKTDYADSIFQTPSSSFTYLGFPLYDPKFENPQLRQAFSMAIDRQAIIDALFDGAYTAASGWVSPTFDGYREGVCTYCEYNPEEAKRLFDEAGGFDGVLQLWANGGAGHEEWLQAVGDQLKETLGIEYKLNTQITDFAQYLTKGDEHDFNGPYRLAWGPDYPVMETYLAPLYGKGGSSNTSGYDNPEFDTKIDEADAAATLEDAIPLYQEAEDMLAEDMPSAPLWFGLSTVVWNPETVEEIHWNTINGLDVTQTSAVS